MRIWQITIGTEELGANVTNLNGVAKTAQEAIAKAMQFAKEECGYKNPYPSQVREIGEKVF